jgi:plasmid stabilization system protein ParE
MEYEVIVGYRAQLDLEEAILWYNIQKHDLGVDFLLEFYVCLDILSTFPNRHQKVHKNIRRVLLSSFPFSVFFEVDEKTTKVIVLAIWDNRRNPSDLEAKLK